MPASQVPLLFALFALSGFTGLIYESLWSHYLQLFLGHAAFAQSFVLAVFMGGLALGAWYAGRTSARTKNLLALYGLTEAAIGAIALVFHEVFVGITDVSLIRIVPLLGSPELVGLFKLAVSLVMLLPQAVLLGMTFPLMSSAVIRRSPERSGHHLAMLYFTNSIGAAIGALVCSFWLLGALGMPGTMRSAGIVNIALGAFVLWLARRPESPLPVPVAAPGEAAAARGFLIAAFITGASSFVYEIAWIRMLSLVLGGSFQAFELMVSAFVTGLALGGLWIRKRIDAIADPARFAGYVQLLMGLAALATILLYHRTFDWMQWLIGSLQRTDSAYALFNAGSHAIAFAIMLPATFLAGMTLPLFTHALLRRGSGEKAIGQVYAANTFGAIAGVILAVHWLMPSTGLKLSLVAGAVLDILLGAWLLRKATQRSAPIEALAALVLGLAATVLVARGASLDPARLSSGVFRNGVAEQAGIEVPFYRDGKTASVAIRVTPDGATTVTSNGKPDASIMMRPQGRPTMDEITGVLLGALPLLAKPAARNYAVIGMGSGLTAEVLLSHSAPAAVDIVEIEPAMAQAARLFRPRVHRPFEDPRSQIHFEDAKTFFWRYGRRYDVIVSEPSNPWVNGVASLFTQEFYRTVKLHLAPDGLFVQWVQVYELNDRLFASVLGALEKEFADYRIYESALGDYIILASPSGRVPPLSEAPAAEKDFLAELERRGLNGTADLRVREFGSRAAISPLFAPFRSPPNSDFDPVLQLEATRARFTQTSADSLTQLATAPVPILEMLHGKRWYLAQPRRETDGLLTAAQNDALEIHHMITDPAAQALLATSPEAWLPIATLQKRGVLCGADAAPAVLEQLQWVAEHTLSQLPAALLSDLWIRPRWIGCEEARLPAAVRERLALYRAVAGRDARAMYEEGESMLQRGVTPSDWSRFTLLAAMLGAKVQGQRTKALELLRRYGALAFAGGGVPAYTLYIINSR